ncbi:hypothetical protein nbrc107697_27420 [Gordonia crocea]|uniref:Mycobacterium membrane protein n=2 Tax=Gordonia crocea TaxID=589162 RepID=A0A7I9V0P6_9ACTN|nr:hypothetical protein nbrc107697_27420 [Gordonia crocea]
MAVLGVAALSPSLLAVGPAHAFGETSVTYYAVSDMPHNGSWTWYDANSRPTTLKFATFFSQRADGKWFAQQTVLTRSTDPRIGMTFASRGQYAGCRVYLNGNRIRVNVARTKKKDATVTC